MSTSTPAADFAAPQYDNSAGTVPADNSALDQAAAIDINDPQLTSEDLTINPEGDAYAAPPPLPDGVWRAKLKALDVKDAKGNQAHFTVKVDRNGKPYLFTALEARVIDLSGKFDGIGVYDRWVATMLMRDGSTGASTVLFKLGKPAPARASHRVIMDALLKALAGEPEVGIETSWEWSCQHCTEAAKKKGEKPPRAVMGMQKFDRDPKTGLYNPERRCDVDKAHGTSQARPRVVRYLSLEELKEAQAKQQA